MHVAHKFSAFRKQMEAITFYILRKKYVISRNIYLIEKIKTWQIY